MPGLVCCQEGGSDVLNLETGQLSLRYKDQGRNSETPNSGQWFRALRGMLSRCWGKPWCSNKMQVPKLTAAFVGDGVTDYSSVFHTT